VGKYYWATLLKGERYKAHERYIAQTRYVDKKLGEILELLKKTGKYDSSLIILTSDHDEKNSLDRTRIPLFVKAPYQQETIPVFERCNTINLNQFLNKYMTKDIIDVRQLYSVSE
jgi:phosphoglycerol transferase MdoB-like AlkP superfamily enzyme